MNSTYSKTEKEVIFLRAITDIVDEMVSVTMFKVCGPSSEANILFHTSQHQKMFNILLVDLLSESDKNLMGCQLSYPEALRSICEEPSFDKESSIDNLRSAVNSFSDWLSVEPTVKVWFPSINYNGHLKLSRSTSISICGNVSKHNILRQSHQAKKLKLILENTGVQVTLEEALLALEDFYKWFHDDIFNYHSSTIAEFLNEIQWGVYEYLLPEYHRSYVCDSSDFDYPRYHFCYPAEVQSELAKTLYWSLMNWMRRGEPFVKRFSVTRHLKKYY